MNVGTPPRPRTPFASLRVAASGLSAQARRIEVVAENIANAQSFTADGTPYRRKVVEFGAITPTDVADGTATAAGPFVRGPETPAVYADVAREAEPANPGGVEVLGVFESDAPGRIVYNPSHPNADESGYVEMPNISITEETADMMDAQRLFEANATVFQALRNMLRRATQI